jgi:hypothetical protein
VDEVADWLLVNAQAVRASSRVDEVEARVHEVGPAVRCVIEIQHPVAREARIDWCSGVACTDHHFFFELGSESVVAVAERVSELLQRWCRVLVERDRVRRRVFRVCHVELGLGNRKIFRRRDDLAQLNRSLR